MSVEPKKPLEKRNFGQLAEFDHLIVFGMKDGGGGMFVDGKANDMQHLIATMFRLKPELRDLFRRCVDEASDIFIPPTPEIVIAKG